MPLQVLDVGWPDLDLSGVASGRIDYAWKGNRSGRAASIMREMGLIPCQPRPFRPTTTVAGDPATTPATRDAIEVTFQTLNRYLSLIQTQRGDFNGKVLTIRRDDVRVLAAILDQSPGGLIERLDDLGLRRPSFG